MTPLRVRPSTPASVADAFRTTLELFETGLDVNPEAGDGEIERRLGDSHR
jgi:hypothetical protein